MWKAITPVMERINDHKLNVLVIDTFHSVVNQCLVLEAEACEGLTDTLIGSHCEAISLLRRDEVLLSEVLQCSRTSLQILFLGINRYGFMSQQNSPELLLCVFRQEF